MPFPRRDTPAPAPAPEPPAPAPDPIHADRVAQLLAMGFSEASAEILASARDHTGVKVALTYVRSALAQGATHEQAEAIFA
jgi:hypothetical protein